MKFRYSVAQLMGLVLLAAIVAVNIHRLSLSGIILLIILANIGNRILKMRSGPPRQGGAPRSP
jgi:hypothetical protein